MDNSYWILIIQAFIKGFIVAWPIFALIAIVFLAKLIYRVYEKKRLAASGIDEINTMDGKAFEKYLEVLFSRLGYKVTRTKYVGDYGADLLTKKDALTYVIQAKRYKKKVGVKAIQEVVASRGYYNCDRAMVVTNNYFTDQARELAQANNVILWDKDDLVSALLKIKKKPDTICLETSSDELIAAVENPVSTPAVCAVCGKQVSEKVRAYCEKNSDKFDGQIYCYEHQKRR